MTHLSSPRVCIIGAGPSGITAVKNLIQAGINNVVCYERNDQVGGNWIYSPQLSHSSVFETTHIISSKSLSQYLDYPMPAEFPPYPSHAQLLQYFQDYARNFGVEKYIQFSTEVTSAKPTSNKQWQVELSNGNTELFDFLLVANGHHASPRMPQYPGNFDGQFIHSHEFKNAAPFKQQRVLVIGGGNSACDCAVETSRVSAFTDISMRRGYYIVPKFMFGLPADVIHQRLLRFPYRIRQWAGQLTYRIMVGNLNNYGLQKPKHWVFQAHPTMNSELLYALGHGKVHPRPDIQHFEGKKVHFVDGSTETYDTIIACTGYNITFPFFDPTLIDYSGEQVPLYLRVFHPQHRNLFFIGLVQPQGCIWPLSDAQAKLVAKYINGNYQLPNDLTKRINDNLKQIAQRYTKSHRHTVEVDFHEHLNELLKEAGK